MKRKKSPITNNILYEKETVEEFFDYGIQGGDIDGDLNYPLEENEDITLTDEEVKLKNISYLCQKLNINKGLYEGIFKKYIQIQSNVWNTVEGFNTVGKILTGMILLLVSVSICMFVLSTDRYFYFNEYFQFCSVTMDYICISTFTIEYAIRFWSCTASNSYYYKKYGFFFGKVFFFISILSIIDLAALVPTYISLAIRYGEGIEVLRGLTALRVLRLFRLFKADRYFNTFGLLGRVIWEKRILLLTSFFVQILFILFASTFLYLIEGKNNPPFNSIIKCIYWVMISLSTVKGGADFGQPVTVIGKVMQCCIGFVCFSSFAVPTSILGQGFQEQHSKLVRQRKLKEQEIKGKKKNGKLLLKTPILGTTLGSLKPTSPITSMGEDGILFTCPHCNKKNVAKLKIS